MLDFLRRLKQRKLVQWSLAYIAAAFSLIQVIDVVADSYDWPHLVMHLVFGALVVGFVVMLLLVWYHGERGAQHLSGAELLLIALALAIGGGLLWHFGRAGSSPAVAMRSPDGARRYPGHTAPDSAVATARSPGTALEAGGPAPQTVQPIPAKSIAVLPFVNESGNEDQQYFSDGLSEDLITALSQFAGLKVISPDSSFQFRHSKDSSAQIGAKLGVAHLLEGSVQRAGGEVRISATLVDASDGTTLWSHHYDRPYKDLFKLQDDITRAVTAVLRAKLLVAPGAVVQSDRPPSGNLAAYNDYLQGQFHFGRATKADQYKAVGFFKSAIRLDPHYAQAWVAEAGAWVKLAGNFVGGAKADAAWHKARVAVQKALMLNPDLAAAHAAKADILATADHDRTGAAAEQRRAHQLAPNRFPKVGQGGATQGHVRASVKAMEARLAKDPLCASCFGQLGFFLRGLGYLDKAAAAQRKELELQPGNYFARMELVYTEVMSDDAAAALKAAQKQPAGSWRIVSMAFALQAGIDRAAADAALKKEIGTDSDDGAYQIAEIYALRRDPDNVFKWLNRAAANRDPGVNELLYDPLILRYRHDPRFAAFCKKVGLPTTTDAVAMK